VSSAAAQLVSLSPPPSSAKVLALSDDLDAASLKTAIARSLAYLEKVPPDRLLSFDGYCYSAAWLKESLLTFATASRIAQSEAHFRRLLMENFHVYAVGDDEPGQDVLVTGYYEPVLAGSLTKQPPFLYPLYRVPPDLVRVKERAESGGQTTRIGRYDNGNLVPYFNRAEIEAGILEGQELVFLADPIAAFILHVQGSGRILLDDGRELRIHYAAANGRPYRSIGRLLVEEGKMRLEEVDLPALRAYLEAAAADERARVLNYNESYVFFQWEREGPLGSTGVVLTPGRSIATDPLYVPPGALGLLYCSKPQFAADGTIGGWQPFTRFVLSQDRGGAIKGPRRVDLFCGSGSQAEAVAGRLKHPGRFFLLVKKEWPGMRPVVSNSGQSACGP